MTVNELRKAYLDFFRSKGHRVFPSDSLVPADDPSLLFTGAGMNQFKPYFLGLKKDTKRAASCQKCLRTADLDRVGKTAYHHTFFEMLGNFSFGDYFKEEAILWGWEFVTRVLKLPKDRLWVSVFEKDDEAYAIWNKKIGLKPELIVRMGAEDNFWPANAPKNGPNGPCGPCSEIYVGDTPGKGVEIWNLVFTQFDRQSDGSLTPLPQKNIDTGMGLERTASVLQQVASNYDIDLFQTIRARLKALLGPAVAGGTAHENAVMDHLRAVTFAITNGALPSNEGRGYVIRKLIRLASDHMGKAGVLKPGSLHRIVPAIVSAMGGAYPEIRTSEKNVINIVEKEEGAFLEVLRTQLPRLEADLRKSADMADTAFVYYDTYGLPFELIQSTAEALGGAVDRASFERRLEEQKHRSRQSSKIAGEIFKKDAALALVEGLEPTEFLGYGRTEAEGVLVKIAGDILIFDRTPFYAEAGGQIGDTGTITGNGLKAEVLDTQTVDRCAAHRVRVIEGEPKAGLKYSMKVDAVRRLDIMKNHTATHLLHAALRKVLGEHVKQSGSLVAGDYLRFDFTHFGAVDPRSLARVEEMVNAEIRKDTPLSKKEMGRDEALKEGAIAFFGEKYGDLVRVVSVGDFSKELCGGTHLESAGQIGLFKIVSEGSIQSGVRRIEAVTGHAARELMEKGAEEWARLEERFGPDGEGLSERIDAAKARVGKLKAALMQSGLVRIGKEMAGAVKSAPEQNGVKLVLREMPGADIELLKGAADALKSQGSPFIVILTAEGHGKISFAIAADESMVKKGFHAGKIVKDVAAVAEGSGGGRPEFAVGGGKNPSKKKEALALGEKRVKEFLGMKAK
ncbi:MAG: alanine--tRNA ligase [Omnitrophica bacterium RIFCSPHIGHO2_02_FULL_63_14]|nr:MAG: alanine--tRNA ligase [Omnitrophica bacterium RIFCSPHIGHO2_02_FULL_63_14]